MKHKTVHYIFLLLLPLSTLFSQESPKEPTEKQEKPKFGWKKELVGSLNLAQTSFNNWSKGGENSTAWQVNVNFKFENDQKKTNWSNSGTLSYGRNKTGDQGSRKSVDEIKLESVYSYKIGICVNPFVAVSGESQFGPGYDYKIEPEVKVSKFMDPGYFRESIGFGVSPIKVVKTRLGAAIKQTVTNQYPSPYADDPDTDKIEKFKNEIGIESVTDINIKLSATSALQSKIELFSNTKAFDEIDVNWDNLLTSKISKYFSFNFTVKLLYDKDVSVKRQLKQSMAIGLSYNFL